ncbi:hypothetical protein ACJJTC_002264 [Scirpophaga incertulas]
MYSSKKNTEIHRSHLLTGNSSGLKDNAAALQRRDAGVGAGAGGHAAAGAGAGAGAGTGALAAARRRGQRPTDVIETMRESLAPPPELVRAANADGHLLFFAMTIAHMDDIDLKNSF